MLHPAPGMAADAALGNFFLTLSRHRIIAGTTPGMASQNASDRQPQPFQGPMLQKSLPCILGTGGREAAGGRRIGRDGFLINPDGHEQQGHERPRKSFPEPSQHLHDFSSIFLYSRQRHFATRLLSCGCESIQMKAISKVSSSPTAGRSDLFSR